MAFHRPQSPEPVRSGIFTYGKDGLKANGFSPESISELKLLFRKNASRARVRAATKPWVMAQLHLYGVSFKKSESAVQLKTALENAVKTGKVSLSHSCCIGALKLGTLTCSSAIAVHHPSQQLRNYCRNSINNC